MSKIDISTVYKDRIEQIDVDMKKARKCENWTVFYKLKSEKNKLEKILKQK